MILTLCGSAKFEWHWHAVSKALVLRGHTCFSLAIFPSTESGKEWYSPAQKQTLDLVHLSKIEQSQGVVMLNYRGYLGESSRRELEWARIRCKQVFWLDYATRLPNPSLTPDWSLDYLISREWLDKILLESSAEFGERSK